MRTFNNLVLAYVFSTFFLQAEHNKVWFFFPILKVILLILIVKLMYDKPIPGCVAFLSKMYNSWYIFLPVDSFDNLCKTQTAPQFF